MKRYKWKCVVCSELNAVGEQFCTKCFHEYEEACKMLVVHEGGVTEEEILETIKGIKSRGYF